MGAQDAEGDESQSPKARELIIREANHYLKTRLVLRHLAASGHCTGTLAIQGRFLETQPFSWNIEVRSWPLLSGQLVIDLANGNESELRKVYQITFDKDEI